MNTRRAFIRSGATLSVASSLMATLAPFAQAHNDPGRVLPNLPVPKLQLTLHDGRKTVLSDALLGQPTAMQLMFTGCSATCPIQGALFSAAQEKLQFAGTPELSHGIKPATAKAKSPHMRLLSITIDPLNDGPGEMRRWLKRFGATSFWQGGTPDLKELDRWYDFL